MAGVRGTETTEVLVAGPATAGAETGLRAVDTAEKLEFEDTGAEPSPSVEAEVEAEEAEEDVVMAVTSVTSATLGIAVGESDMIEKKALT